MLCVLAWVVKSILVTWHCFLTIFLFVLFLSIFFELSVTMVYLFFKLYFCFQGDGGPTLLIKSSLPYIANFSVYKFTTVLNIFYLKITMEVPMFLK